MALMLEGEFIVILPDFDCWSAVEFLPCNNSLAKVVANDLPASHVRQRSLSILIYPRPVVR